MPLILRTPVLQAACTLPTLPAPASPRALWATAQQARAVVESRLELVVVQLLDLVREALLVAMVELAAAVVVTDAVEGVVDVEVRHTALVGVTYSYSFSSEHQEITLFYFLFFHPCDFGNSIPTIERLTCIAFMFLRVSTTFGPNMKRHIYPFMHLSD